MASILVLLLQITDLFQTWARGKIDIGGSKIFEVGGSSQKNLKRGVTKIQLGGSDLFLPKFFLQVGGPKFFK